MANVQELAEGNQSADNEVLVLWTAPGGPMEGDTVLPVSGKRIAVNKQYLAQHSEYFHTRFFGAWSARDEELPDDVDKCIDVLLSLLPTRKGPAEDNELIGLYLIDIFNGDTSGGALTEGNNENDDGVLVLWKAPGGAMEGDTVIRVGNTRIAVNKQYLAQYSRFFHRLFFSKSLEEYEIYGVNANALIEMLLVVLPTRKPITEANVEWLLEMADRFEFDWLRSQCLSYLNSPASVAVPIVVHTLIAFKLDLDELKSRCLARLHSVGLIEELRQSQRYYDLPNEAHYWLLDRTLQLASEFNTNRVILANGRPLVFLAGSFCDAPQDTFRFVVELFTDSKPEDAELFRTLCTSEKSEDESGQTATFKGVFIDSLTSCEEEDLDLAGSHCYLLRQSWNDLCNSGKGSLATLEIDVNGDHATEAQHLQAQTWHLCFARGGWGGERAAFGRVVEGLEQLKEMFELDGGFRPRIEDCGQM